MVDLICEQCEKEYRVPQYRSNSRFCCRNCNTIYKKENGWKGTFKFGKEHVCYKGTNIIHICKNCEQEFYNSYKPNKLFCSRKCYKEFTVGENHKNFNPLLDRINRKDLSQGKRWSFQIKQINNFRCIKCKSNKKLISHHLESWNTNKRLRFDLSNGVCLCENCHLKFHKNFGFGNNTFKQFEVFMHD